MKSVLLGAAVAALSVVVAGCGSGSAGDAAPPPPSSSFADQPPPLVDAVPLPVNAVADAVARLDGLAAQLMERSGIPGMAVAVVHGGRTVYSKGFGVRDVRDPAATVDGDTVFQLASLSKPIGATVVAHEVTDGAVGWDTPVVEHLPWFALADPAVTRMVTVGDLYAHRSGLPDHAGDLLEELGYDRRHILGRLRTLPLSPFRVTYAYTNFGLTAAAEAVAAAAGRPWEDLSRDALYAPLGMTSTSSRFDDYLARPDRAVGHIHLDGRYQPLYVRDPQPEAPAGGVSSSANDVAKWLAMLLADGSAGGQRIASPEALLPALTPQIVNSPASEPAARSGFYGYGFNVGATSAARMSLSHSGAFELGANTNFVMLPSADVAIVALTNATPAGVPETLTAQFADLVQFGQIREDWYALYNGAYAGVEAPLGSLAGQPRPPRPAPPAALPTYLGTYRNDYYGPATVSEVDGALQLALGSQLRVPLQHWDGNVFTFSHISENSPPGSISRATFDGAALTLEYFNDDGNGVFTR